MKFASKLKMVVFSVLCCVFTFCMGTFFVGLGDYANAFTSTANSGTVLNLGNILVNNYATKDRKFDGDQLDKLYEKYESDIDGLVFICNVNNTIADRINKALESSNYMSICRTEILGCNSESSDNATMVMREIKNKSLREALEIIEKNRDIMDSEHVIICQAIAYHSNGDITKTIELLNSIYKTLSNDQKLFLAEMYILQESKKEAKEIFEEVFRDDKWERGLYELGLKVYEKDEQRYIDILNEGIIYQPESMFLAINSKYGLSIFLNQQAASLWFP